MFMFLILIFNIYFHEKDHVSAATINMFFKCIFLTLTDAGEEFLPFYNNS